MKNFTNNFKQFTSRLSARWLIIALMMLVGTSSAWAVEYYLRGTFNGWETNNPFSSNTCTITLAANQEYTFKIADSKWNNDYTYGKTDSHITETCEIELLNNTNNQEAKDCKITTKDAGSYTFVFTPNGSKGTLKVTYPTPTPTPPTPTAPVVSTTSAVIDGENLVCKGKVTSMGAASTVVWAFTVLLSPDAISKADSDWKYPKDQNQITAANTPFTYNIPISSLSLTKGKNYYVRAMAVDLNNLGMEGIQYGNAVAGDAILFEYDPCTLPTSIQITGAATPCANATNIEYTATINGGDDYELVWSVTGEGYRITEGQGTTSAIITVGSGAGSITCTAKCSESSTEESNTINIAPYSAKQPELSVYPTTGYICEGEKATISIADPELNVQSLTYQLYNETTSANVGDAISPTSKPIEFPVEAAGTYRVNVSHTCGGTQSSNKITINYYASPEIPKLILTKPTKCGGTANANGVIAMGNSLPGITYTLKKGNVTCPLDQDGTKWSGLEAGTYTIIASQTACTTPQTVRESVVLEVEEISPVATVSIISASYDMNAGTFTVSGNLDHAGCSESIYVGYRYKLSNDDTWSDLINTHHLTEAGIFTKEGISIAGAAAGQTYLFQTYAINGHPDYQEISAVFSSSTIEVEVQDGYTVYLRRPHAKNETTDYNAWFEKTAEAGPGYIKFGTVIKQNPGATNIYKYNGGTSASAKDPNEVAVRGTEAFTDCEGHVWDAYSIGLDVKDIYFRAPNDKSASNTFYSGYNTYTWSYSQNTPIAEDLYFTMGPKNTTGMTLNKVEKPFEGIEIDALGSTEICSNNMASFAALYLKSNCTGQDITAYAWKFSTNNSSWGEYTTGKGANTNNIRPNKEGYYHLECKLKDGSVVTSNSIHITTTNCSISNEDLNNITSNLPIIMVNTGDKAFPSVDNGKHCSASADDLKKKRSVDVKILWNKNGTVTSTDAYSNGANLYYDRKARMNYRGSSSLNFEKKSFAFCPGDEMCGDDEKSADYVKTKEMNMFNIGSAEDKDWVLYAAYPDPSMMRNILAMETYSAMTGKWGVKNQYVELYIDGKYQGVYVFMDKITKNDNRVNIKWKIDKSDDSKSKREFILKFDKTDVADRYEDASGDQKTFESDMTGKTGINTYDTKVDQRFEIEYPEKEDIEEDYGEGAWAEVYTFISGKVNEFEKAIADGDFNKVRNLINYESWADFFIINEFTKNVDAYRASCIFVYTGGKFEAWPLWDYELSFNNTVTGSGKGRGETTGLLIEHSDVYSDEFPAPFWWTGKYNGSNMYSGLLKDPCFVQMIKTRWAEHTKAGGPLNPSTTTAKTAAYKKILDAQGAATREFTKWPVTSRGKDACNNVNTGYFDYGGDGSNTTYENSYKELNKWLAADQRLKGLDDAIKNLAKIIEFGITATADKDETTPWRAVNVKVDAVGADYTYTVTPEIVKGQVIQGSDNLLIYAEPATLPQTYTVVTTLNAKDQCGGKDADNASSRVTFTVNDLVENCEE